MPIKNNNYELLEERNIEDLNSVGFILKHKKSGARVVLLSNDDDNKVFNIGFKTPPYNDCGLPHILEHSVLCGSKKYPAKDPFVELCKGSLNTFLNAMTYPDKTVYPVASCNMVDFMNIVDVYMDAVFNPNIYSREEIFRQEGWHFEMESEDGPITYNGVVYNEMKGAFSDADDLLSSYTFKTLFPDNEYGNESGGNPEKIPDLSYEEFLEFHKKYYHPSNSYIYVYGDMDMEEFLDYMDREYLCKYDAKDIDSEIKEQKAFDQVKDVSFEYAVTEDEGTEDNAYLSYNAVIGNVLDRKLYLAFQIIDYALVSAPGAPLKKALVDAGIGADVYGSYESSIYQPMYSIVVKNADEKRKDEFVKIIMDSLNDIVVNGIDEKAFRAGINYFEFKYREADFGSYPKGLMYGLQALDSWLYDDMAPFYHIEANETFAFLKENVNKGYFEEIIRKYIIENTHAALITLIPKINLTAIMDEKTRKKLEAYKKSLSEEQIKKIVADTKHLKEYQDEPSTDEELQTIPMLKREDIGREAAPLYIDEKVSDDVKIIHSNIFTNKIVYMNLSYDCKSVPERLIPYIGLLRNVLGLVDTDKHEYGDLFNEINMNCGGLVTSSTVYTNDKDISEYQIRYEVKAKALYDKIPFVMDTMLEIMYTSHFDDYKRIKEILSQMKSRLQTRMTSGGHVAAISHAMAQFSPSVYYSNITTGIEFYQFVDELESHFEEKKEEIKESLSELVKLIFDRKNLIVSLTVDDEGYKAFEPEFKKFVSKLNDNRLTDAVREYVPKKNKNGFMTSSQVNYVARCGNYRKAGFDYTGAFRILKTIFGYDYLWINIRVKGGAYGCMSGFYKNGDSYMVSFRDPNIKETNEIYENAVDYIRNFSVSERDMTKYVIGTIGELDTPMNPQAKGNRSFSAYLSNVNYEDLLRERIEIIDASANDIRNLYAPVKEMLVDDYFAVIGNAEQIKECEDMFDTVKNLF
ncbi:MAG: insulinase family protein [Lachnospiraceae bacterium]